MYTPVLSAIILIFIFWFRYEVKRSNQVYKKSSDAYWQRDNEANNTRRVDISNLNYIAIPLESLPMTDKKNNTLNSYRDMIQDLATKKILNLTGYTNTDLKFKYGLANISYLSECDKNYTTLVSMLQKWGERLYSHGDINEAISVLEFGVTCQTDVRSTYRLLAKMYLEQHTPEYIDHLIQVIQGTHMAKKNDLIDELEKIK